MRWPESNGQRLARAKREDEAVDSYCTMPDPRIERSRLLRHSWNRLQMPDLTDDLSANLAAAGARKIWNLRLRT